MTPYEEHNNDRPSKTSLVQTNTNLCVPISTSLQDRAQDSIVHSNNTNDQAISLTHNVPVTSPMTISRQDWIAVIQEAFDDSDNNTKRTFAQQYPRLWKMCGVLVKQWVTDHWQHPKKAKNLTNFKTKIVRHIVSTRKYVPKTTLTGHDKQLYTTMFPNFPNVFVYDRDLFHDFAISTWQVDKVAAALEDNATVSDILRLYSIVIRNDNRDALNSLNTSKTYNRRDVDGAMGRDGSIFHRFGQQFNDPGLTLQVPDRAQHLNSFRDISINDATRIEIQQDHVWLRQLYFKTLTTYRRTMKKWKSGTGGGEGAPENYADWNTREDESFTNYGGHQGDTMAWIYMLDKKEGFPFLEMYEDAPMSTTIEDSAHRGVVDAARLSPGKRKRGDVLRDVGTNLCETMTNGFQMMSEALSTMSDTGNTNARAEAAEDLNAEIQSSLALVEKLESHLTQMHV